MRPFPPARCTKKNGIREYWSSGILAYRILIQHTSFQLLHHSIVPIFHYSSIPIFQHSNTPLFQSSSTLPPHLPRGLDDDFEFSLLLIFADQVANHIGSKTALRADRQLVKRDVLGSLIEAALQRVDRLRSRDFRAHETEHNDLPFGQKTQRLKGPGTRCVVLEEKPVMMEFVEKALCDRVIGALAMPHAALVAATEVNPKRNSRKAANDLVVGPYRAGKVLLRILAALAHCRQRRGINVRRITGSIDLDVAAACRNQPLNHFALDVDDVGDKIVYPRIDRRCILVVEALGNAVGTNQGYLHGLLRHAAREPVLF